VEEVPVERQILTFLYDDTQQCWLMNSTTFEQIGIPTGLLGKRRPFLRDGMPLSVAFVDGQPAWADFGFEQFAECRVVDVFPPPHYQSAYKWASLENGVEVSVPLFIEAGDAVHVHIDSLTVLAQRNRSTWESKTRPG
jgi:elongation factor P